MSLRIGRSEARAQVRRAREELDRAERQLATTWPTWGERWRRHRVGFLIGGGLLGGFAVAWVPPRRVARAGAAATRLVAWIAGSAVGPVLLGALAARLLGPRADASPHERPS